VGWAARRARELADPVVVRVRREGRVSRPLPPRRLRARTGAPGAREFAAGGQETAAALADALPAAGRSIADVRAVLDFGCGSGRVLPSIARLAANARCCGCDVDPAAITWAARHLRDLEWVLSGAEPPLPFATERFDLVYSISVFSHLDEPLQDRWLAELARVLVPGGVALLSVHGAHAFEEFRSLRVRTRWCPPVAFARGPLRADELVFEPYRRSVWNRGELPGVADSYGLTFHGDGYIRRRWSRWLEVLDVRERAVAGWQDLVVVRRA
jgi:SAM-dependent methyltransferase